ncbi:MAG TPA: hypothetical protein V6C58_09330 [Allocoleopsis sp.]
MLKKSLVIFSLLASFFVTGLPTLAQKPRIKPKTPKNSIIKTNKLDLSKIILNAKDLPEGFKLDNQEKKANEYSFVWENTKEESFELIIGYTGILNASLAQIKKTNPDLVKQSITQVFDQIDFAEELGKKMKTKVEVISSEELKLPEDIGDISAGKTLLLNVGGISTHLDQVVFIRGNVMTMLIKIHKNDDPDVVPIITLLRTMDTRLKQYF